MPPGSAESLPPSNAKPSTPSPSNGVSCSKLEGGKSPPGGAEMAGGGSDCGATQPSPAPKPFKKRYLAEQSQAVAGVSPEAATACEALMELARTESRAGSRSSEGSERRGSPGSEGAPPLQSLREAVWSKVATTLLKQEEEKLVVPPKDSPMNLSQQCTIRGTQIIEHIIETILDKPVEGQYAPCEPINVSVNNNQEEGIKASIYESLKNDLLMGKTPPMASTASSTPNTAGPARTTSCPPAAPTTTASTAARPRPSKERQVVTAAAGCSSPPVPASQDVLRLLAGNSQLPISVGNSAITITKTPRVTQSAVSQASTTPVSVSLTRSATNQVLRPGVRPTSSPHLSSQQVFNLNSVPVLVSSQQSGSPGQVGGTVVLGQSSDCVLLSPVLPQQASQLVQLGSSSQPVLIAAGGKLILASSSPQPSPAPQQQQHDSPDPVNLTVTKPMVAVKRPAPGPVSPEEEEDIRRSARSGKGRRYQEFIEDGRLSAGGRRHRNSHRSGEEAAGSSDLEPEPLRQEPAPAHVKTSPITTQVSSNQINHWKKKLRTASLGENTQQQLLAASKLPAHLAAGSITAKSPDQAGAEHHKKREDRENKVKSGRVSGSSRATRQSGQQERAAAAHTAHTAHTRQLDTARLATRKLRGEKI